MKEQVAELEEDGEKLDFLHLRIKLTRIREMLNEIDKNPDDDKTIANCHILICELQKDIELAQFE